MWHFRKVSRQILFVFFCFCHSYCMSAYTHGLMQLFPKYWVKSKTHEEPCSTVLYIAHVGLSVFYSLFSHSFSLSKSI